MKIGRNDPCPCGSGIKYKKCCLNKSYDQRLVKAFVDSTKNLERESRIKQCLHPNHTECKGPIVKAHAIQNNRILKKLGDNGIVITTNGVSNLFFQNAEPKGRGIASVFTGFCKYHDKTLFQPIEDCDFTATEEQVFLLTYRTMAWHYHKKEEQYNRTVLQQKRLMEKGFSPNDDGKVYLDYMRLGLKDNEHEKTLFDKALLAKDYSTLNYIVWELPYEVLFTVSMSHELDYDIVGNELNDVYSKEPLKKIYLNIFPAEGKSFCIWSWLKIHDSLFAPFATQFLKLDTIDKENYLNNNLPRWSDSVIISPALWSKWGEPIQQAYITHANFTPLYIQTEKETGQHAYEYMYTPWNLFDTI